ncbi:hypothetical protein RJ640_024546 [Escallonia rubra]|uniref:60S ribosomal protein L13 n=1 Tax=Escallonia rubra TaxID=112253 RepID=A0AA88RWX7_9ASTE|nr:hypothetical protein RJ640_024546 [Escallonia rubra]
MPMASGNPGAATLGLQKKLVPGKLWLSITMLYLMGTARSTGRILSRLGLTNLPARQVDELDELLQMLLLYFSTSFVPRLCLLTYLLVWSPARQKKAVKIFPRPTVGPLRPIVHGQTLKYNMKVSAGKGFSLEELKAAGIPKKVAATIGMAVDHRRRNRSLEGLQANVQRVKSYKAKLVVFPSQGGIFQAGESSAEELEYMPILSEKPTSELVKITDEMKSFKACDKLRVERMNQCYIGAEG